MQKEYANVLVCVVANRILHSIRLSKIKIKIKKKYAKERSVLNFIHAFTQENPYLSRLPVSWWTSTP